MTWWTVAWLAWLAAFGVIEGAALARKARGDTLSEHVWAWFGIGARWTWWTVVRRVVLAAFLVWLAVHFLTGGLSF